MVAGSCRAARSIFHQRAESDALIALRSHLHAPRPWPESVWPSCGPPDGLGCAMRPPSVTWRITARHAATSTLASRRSHEGGRLKQPRLHPYTHTAHYRCTHASHFLPRHEYALVWDELPISSRETQRAAPALATHSVFCSTPHSYESTPSNPYATWASYPLPRRDR